MPCTCSSAFSASTAPSSSSCVQLSGSRRTVERMPARLHAFSLLCTYTWLAGFSPATTTARCGVTPFSIKACVRCAAFSFHFFATSRPSIQVTDMNIPPLLIKRSSGFLFLPIYCLYFSPVFRLISACAQKRDAHRVVAGKLRPRKTKPASQPCFSGALKQHAFKQR